MTEMTAADVLAGVKAWAEQLYQAADLKVEVALHGGRFIVTDLERYATKSQACRVALEGVRFELNGRGELIANGHVVVVVLAGDHGRAGDRAVNVLKVAAPIQAALPGSRNGLELMDSIDAKTVRAANLYHAELDKRGSAAWVITWPVEFKHPRVR
ncbi:hypothetical protein D9M70_358710 [compost metagenome]